MKKKLAASLALAFTMGIAGTAFAANPFVDVPAKHWSYDAVSKLAADGIVDGYGDGSFKGDKTMTRYEMATVVAKAMAKEEKASAEDRALIQKLSTEYAQELDNLGVKVAALEKKAAADTVNITGEARLRSEIHKYDTYTHDGDTFRSNNDWTLRTRLHVNGKINDEWSYYARLQSINDLNKSNDGGETDVTMDNAYASGPVGATTLTAGRFDYFKGHGLMIDSTLNGANVAFGSKLKTNVFYGTDNGKRFYAEEKPEAYGVDFEYAAGKTNLNAGYYVFKDSSYSPVFDSDKVKVWEVGFDTPIVKNLTLNGDYGKSDVDEEDTAYLVGLTYKAANVKAPGSFDIFASYRNVEAAASPAATFDQAYAWGTQAAGGKGYEVGFHYVPTANALLRFQYVDLKATNDDFASNKSKLYQTQVEFFF